MITCIIIDDEKNSRDNLETLVQKYCPNLSLLGKASSALEGLELIRELSPAVVFLDIQMPGGDGFSMLQKLEGKKPWVVFVTAFEKYALKAIKASALDYLLKPVSISELTEASLKIEEVVRTRERESQSYEDSLKLLMSSIRDQSPMRIALPAHNGFRMEEVKNIVRLESDSNYTTVYLMNKEKVVISKPLKHFEECLDERVFLRIHNSHIVNSDFLKAYHRDDGGTVELKDGTILQISKRRLAYFLDIMKDKFLKV
jgi:two-component system LytT family response regulator